MLGRVGTTDARFDLGGIQLFRLSPACFWSLVTFFHLRNIEEGVFPHNRPPCSRRKIRLSLMMGQSYHPTNYELINIFCLISADFLIAFITFKV